MVVDDEQIEPVDPGILPGRAHDLKDFSGQIRGDVLGCGGIVGKTGHMLQHPLAAQMGFHRHREADHQTVNDGPFRGIGPEQSGSFQTQVAAIVDELPPEFAGLPPAIIRFLVPKREQHTQNQRIHNREQAVDSGRLDSGDGFKRHDCGRIQGDHHHGRIQPPPDRQGRPERRER